MKTKKMAALLLSGAMLASVLSGCGSVDKDAVVATLDGEEIKLGVANFAARLTQANLDDIYAAYFGDGVWSQDLYSSGSTTQESVKTNVISDIKEMYILKNHMDDYSVSLSDDETSEIADVAAQFMSDNTQEALDQLGATEDIVEEYLTLYTIKTKMETAIKADADTNVSDDEANERGYSYVKIDTAGYTDDDNNYVEYTDDEKAELETTAESLAKACQDDFDGAITDAGYTVSTGTYAADDESLDEEVVTALDALSEGEISDLVTTDSAYYILRLDTECDEEATENHRQEIITDRQTELYDEVYGGWEDDADWNLDEDVWATVEFKDLFTTKVEDTETEEPAEATESVNETEAVSETEETNAAESVNETEAVEATEE